MSKETIGYKVVRENWTDCYSGTLLYAVGETASVPNPGRGTNACGAGLHAALRLLDVLRYRNGQWPLHVLRVEGTPIATDGEKFRCGSLAVLEELPLHAAFGPNGEKAVKLLDDLKTFPWFAPPELVRPVVEMHVAEHLQRLSRYGSPSEAPVRFVTARAAARAAAWAAAMDAARDTARDASMDAAMDAAWDAAMDAAWDAAWAAAWAAAMDTARAAAWAAARDTARAAAWAAAWDTARDASWDAAWDTARDASWDAAMYAARDTARAAAWAAARDAARDAAWIITAENLPPNPFESLTTIWRLGYWPIGIVSGEFVVYEPPVGGAK